MRSAALTSVRLNELAHEAWTSERPTVRLLRSALNVVGAGWLVTVLASSWSIPGFDTFAYWAFDPSHPYSASVASIEAGAYRYSPALGQLLDPLGALSWGMFHALFLAASLVALTVLGGRWALALLLIPNVLGEVYLGNIDLFVAVALGLGPVWPVAWVFLVLSKATPAVVLVWFVVRREWRRLGVVMAGVVIVALPSLITTPGLWGDWIRVSTQFAGSTYGASTIPVVPRVVAAAVLVAIGARRGWLWTIAVGGTLAMPGLDWKTLSALLAILPLYGLGLLADLPDGVPGGVRRQRGTQGDPSAIST